MQNAPFLNAEMPNAEMPNAEMPNAEMPNAEMPNAEMPNAEWFRTIAICASTMWQSVLFCLAICFWWEYNRINGQPEDGTEP